MNTILDTFPKNKVLFPPTPRLLRAWGEWVQKGSQFDVLHEKIDLWVTLIQVANDIFPRKLGTQAYFGKFAQSSNWILCI